MSDATLSQLQERSQATPARSRLPRLLLLLGLVILLLWLGVKSYRLARIVESLQARQSAVEVVLGGNLSQSDPAQLELLVTGLRADVIALNREAALLAQLGPLLGWLPRVGPVLANGSELLAMADAGSEAAALAFAGLRPALEIMQADSPAGSAKIPAAVQAIGQAAPQLTQAQAALQRLAVARQALTQEERLPYRVRVLLDRLDAELPAAQAALHLAPVLPNIMGVNGRRSYLIMAQNEDELRPTGGFLTGAGVLVVEGGQIVSLALGDSYGVDDWHHKPYDFSPQPYIDFMGLQLFFFRDANFWPDFPTSAEKAMQLYTYGQNAPLDGAIAFDQRFLEMLLAALGPLPVPELNRTVTSDNVVKEMRRAWGPDSVTPDGVWVGDRKAFMGALSEAILARLLADFASVNPAALGRAIMVAAEQRHLQLYMRDPDVAAAVAASGWDGRQANSLGQDFLLVADTNMGYNKANVLVSRAMTYSVALDRSLGGQANLQVAYRNQAPADGQPCVHGRPWTVNTRYEDLVQECYWNYLRVYAPAGARLLAASSHPLAGAYLITHLDWAGQAQVITDDPSGLAVFANLLMAPRGTRQVASFSYGLPPAIIAQEGETYLYRLQVNKQAGTDADHFRLEVALPAGAALVSAIPAPALNAAGRLTFDTPLLVDQLFEIRFR